MYSRIAATLSACGSLLQKRIILRQVKSVKVCLLTSRKKFYLQRLADVTGMVEGLKELKLRVSQKDIFSRPQLQISAVKNLKLMSDWECWRSYLDKYNFINTKHKNKYKSTTDALTK